MNADKLVSTVRTSAEILQFVPRSPQNRFTTADRLELLAWELTAKNIRLEIYKRLDDDPPEIGEFASIYPADGPWAAWGAVREGRNINVWRANDGRDVGRFSTMSEALRAVTG